MVDMQYERLLHRVLTSGCESADRTGTGTRKIFGAQLRYNLFTDLPVVTTKKIHLKSVIAELLWMLSGSTNVRPLQEQGVTIWDGWCGPDGELGPVYGAQWRKWPDGRGGTIDQMQRAIDMLRTDPDSRRIIVSAWNVAELDQMALPPCHMVMQFSSSGGGFHRGLSLQVYQRSADVFLGLPFNITSYAMLLRMMAQQVNMEPGDLIWTGGDIHLYDNHVDQAREQVGRKVFQFPIMSLRKAENLFSYSLDDFDIGPYNPHPAIKAPVSV